MLEINLDSNSIALYASIGLNLFLAIRLIRMDRKKKKDLKDNDIRVANS